MFFTLLQDCKEKKKILMNKEQRSYVACKIYILMNIEQRSYIACKAFHRRGLPTSNADSEFSRWGGHFNSSFQALCWGPQFVLSVL